MKHAYLTCGGMVPSVLTLRRKKTHKVVNLFMNHSFQRHLSPRPTGNSLKTSTGKYNMYVANMLECSI